MGLKILGLLKEPNFDERVCLLPKEVKRIITEFELEVLFEPGLGFRDIPDEAYIEAGAIPETPENIFQNADAILSVNHIYNGQEIGEGCRFIGIYNLLFHKNRLENYLGTNATVFSLDLLPRSTLAQSMDVLSSMASLAGYKAVLKAAELFGGVLPMFTTAAGTLKPGKVLVLGAGVAGLQAIATAKRLGAVVEAFDVRSSSAEEVRSLGAKFIEVPGYEESGSAGGYAVAQSELFIQKQKELIKKHIQEADIVICTANIPGKKSPRLVDRDAVENMQTGSVIIDLAAEQGGNCELTINGSTIDHNGVTIVGNSHLSREITRASSQLLSNNYFSFIKHMIKTDNLDDPLLKGCRVIENGQLVHPSFVNELETA